MLLARTQKCVKPLISYLFLSSFFKFSQIDCDTSSAASTVEVTSPPIMQNRKQNLGKLKLALPLKQRLQIVADSSQDDSSSSDGTPQRRILHEDSR